MVSTFFRRLWRKLQIKRLYRQLYRSEQQSNPTRVRMLIEMGLETHLHHYTPRIGTQCSLTTIRTNADNLVETLRQCQVAVSNRHSIPVHALTPPTHARTRTVDDFLVDDYDYVVDLLEFYQTLRTDVERLLADLERLGDSNAGLYESYCRKLTHIFFDVQNVWEALVKLAWDAHVRRSQGAAQQQR